MNKDHIYKLLWLKKILCAITLMFNITCLLGAYISLISPMMIYCPDEPAPEGEEESSGNKFYSDKITVTMGDEASLDDMFQIMTGIIMFLCMAVGVLTLVISLYKYFEAHADGNDAAQAKAMRSIMLGVSLILMPQIIKGIFGG